MDCFLYDNNDEIIILISKNVIWSVNPAYSDPINILMKDNRYRVGN